MEESIRQKLGKIYELVSRGATEGERTAAKLALDRILEKYNIDESELANIRHKQYAFKYKTSLHNALLCQILKLHTEFGKESARIRPWTKEIISNLTYLEWVTVDSMYEYFKRHMQSQWQKSVKPELDKCRTTKTRKRKREFLNDIFFSQYLINSRLYKESDLTKVTVKNDQELLARLSLLDVEGGSFHCQVMTSNLLGE